MVLCAGALQSPQLLQLSGVGPAALLRQFGIGIVRDLPGVGENLQDHLQIRLIYETTKPITTNDQLRTLSGRARMGLEWLLFRSGPLAVGINQGGLFCRVDPASRTPDTQFHFATLSADMAGGNGEADHVMAFVGKGHQQGQGVIDTRIGVDQQRNLLGHACRLYLAATECLTRR
ncbi:Oxygen-dependent choline dehydrogenase [compost metagenome]